MKTHVCASLPPSESSTIAGDPSWPDLQAKPNGERARNGFKMGLWDCQERGWPSTNVAPASAGSKSLGQRLVES